MRILIFFPGTLRGGCEEQAIILARAASQAGHEVTACFPVVERTQSILSELGSLGLSVISWPLGEHRDGRLMFGDSSRQSAAAMAVLDGVAPDAVLMFLPEPDSSVGVICTCAARDLPTVPVFCLVPEHWSISAEDSARCARARRQRQRWVVTSVDNRRNLIDLFRISTPDEVTVVPNGIDLPEAWQDPERSVVNEARSELRRELGIPGTARVVLTVARLARAKGHRDLLAAIALLPESCADAYFAWAGTGVEEEHLRAATATSGLDGQVRFLGYRDSVAPLLYAADLFVLPTYGEGLSLAVIEAMSAGLPVVISDASSNPELVEDGRHGLLFSARDPAALADRLGYALGHPAEMRQMAQAARLKARSEHNSNTMCENMLRVVHGVTPP